MEWTWENEQELIEEAKKIFEQETMRLREGVYCFMQENWKEIERDDILEYLSKKVFMEMIVYMMKNPKSEDQKEASDVKGKKRIEPSQKDHEATENPELKKTKK